MKKPLFTGCATALITPMKPDGSVDYQEFERLAKDQIEKGIDALVVCGTTGESATLSDEEHCELFRRAAAIACGRIPVIAGTGSNNTARAVQRSCAAAGCGVDGLLVVTPYYNKTSQQGLIQHFTTIAEAAQLPVILYNVPSRTGMTMEAATVTKLAENPWICGIKEASGNLALASRILAACGDDFALYSGNDQDTLPLLSLGGAGVISVISNLLPAEMKALCAAWQNGEYIRARQLHYHLQTICEVLFCEVNPIPVKYAMQRIGWNAGSCRLPLCELESEKKNRVDAVLRQYELI